MGISSSIEPDNHLFIYSPCSDLLLCVPLWLVLCHSQLDLQLLITPLLHTMPQHQLMANHQYTTRPPNHMLSNTVLLTITLELNSVPKKPLMATTVSSLMLHTKVYQLIQKLSHPTQPQLISQSHTQLHTSLPQPHTTQESKNNGECYPLYAQRNYL